MDPVEVRRRNLIPPFEDGHDVVTGLTYDSGNYQARARQGARSRQATTSCAPSRRALRKQGPLPRHRRRRLRRDLRPRAVAGRRRGRLPGRTLGERDRPRSTRPARSTSSSARRRTARAKRRRSRRSSPTSSASSVDDVKVIHGDTDDDADGLGHLRQPHHGGRRRRADARDAQSQGEGQAARRAPARGRGRGHGLRRRQVLREGLARQARRRSRTSR